MNDLKSRQFLASEIAVLVSLLMHLGAFTVWEYRAVLAHLPGLRSWVRTTPPAPVRKAEPPTITFLQMPAEAPRKVEEPRQFIETDASQVTGEEPKSARYYSDRSTVAANPNNPTGKLGDTPYLEGKETRLTATENVVPHPGPSAAPAPPPTPPPKPTPAAPKKEEPPKEVAEEGFKVVEEKKMAMLEKPAEPTPPVAPPPPSAGSGSAREIASVKSRLTASGIARTGIAAFNVAGSPFGEYDKALIRAVQSRWYALIGQNRLDERAGTVLLQFQLLPDGAVSHVTIKENSAGQILGLFCEKAVVDSSPFAPLPESLRALIGDDPREINFTFYY